MLIHCECGQAHRVDRTMAGNRISCQCGDVLYVPALSRLREMSPEVQLKAEFSNPYYWTSNGCFLCGAYDFDHAHLYLRCEQAQYGTVPGQARGSVSNPLTMLFGGMFSISVTPPEKVLIKPEYIVNMPLGLCSECKQKDRMEERIEFALNQHPIGAELKHDFPDLVVRARLE